MVLYICFVLESDYVSVLGDGQNSSDLRAEDTPSETSESLDSFQVA